VARRDARDWTYSRDVASALLSLMDAPRPRHDLYHVSAQRTCSVLDWGNALARHFPGFRCRLARAGETANVELHGDDDRLPMSGRRLTRDIGCAVPGDVATTAADFAAWMKRYPEYWQGQGA
jgi:UDP-glucose 4-epimerase